MKRNHVRIILLISVAAITTALAAGRLLSSGGNSAEENGAWPKVLRLAYSPGSEEAEEVVKSYEPYTDYLARVMGCKVKLVQSSGYSVIVEAMRANKVDVASMGPFTYVIATSKTGVIEPLVARGTRDGQPRQYNSYLITHKNAGLKSLDDVKARASEITFQFNDPASTSGHLVPRTFLESIGLVPEESFNNVIFGMSHTATIMSVLSEKVDLAGVNSSSFDKLLREGQIKDEDFEVLWKSDPIVSSPMVVRSTLPEVFKDSLRQAYLHMPEWGPEAFEVVSSRWSDTTIVYVPVQDSLYNTLRRMAAHVNLVRNQPALN